MAFLLPLYPNQLIGLSAAVALLACRFVKRLNPLLALGMGVVWGLAGYYLAKLTQTDWPYVMGAVFGLFAGAAHYAVLKANAEPLDEAEYANFQGTKAEFQQEQEAKRRIMDRERKALERHAEHNRRLQDDLDIDDDFRRR